MRKLLYVAVAVSALLMLMLAAATPAMAASVGRWAGQADNTGTGPSWTDLSNATGSQNGGYASVDIAPKGHSGNLTLTYFGFTSSDIPAGSTLSSIKVDVYCSGTSQIQDYGVYLVNGSSSSNNKAVTTSWNTSSQPISHNYTISGWGIASWTLADIVGNDNFGVSISAYNNHGTLSRTAYVDAVRITVYYTPAGGPGGGVGGGIPVTLDLVGSIGGDGVVSGDQEYTTPDGGATLDIPGGTTVVDENGNPVWQIGAVGAPVAFDPSLLISPPEGACILSIAWEFTPSGTTFTPPAVLTIKYPTDLAELQSLCPGVTLTDPPNIVIAYYDSVLGWTVIPSWVDTTNHTVSGNVSHFTKFALYSPPPAPPAPEPTPTLAPVEVPVVTEAPLPTAAPVEVPVVTEAPSPTAAPVVAPSPTEAPTPAPAPAAEANKTNIGVIVGPIVAVIIIALVAYWFLSRRKKAPVAK